MAIKAVFIFMVLLRANLSYAQEACPETISTYQHALACAELRSPIVQRAQLELDRAKKMVGAASQWKNPEFSADSVHGDVASGRASETGLSLGVPIELGGKISARTAVANSGVAKAEATLFALRAKVRTAALLKLHRLRQLLHEQEVIDESISTFSKLVMQYSKRLKLSPEQELTVAVFRMSKSDYDLKKMETFEELESIDSFLKVSLNSSVDQLSKGLPSSPKKWPKLESAKGPLNSPRLKLAQAELSTALAELSLAQSESWPTVVVGPSLKLQTESGRSDQLYGINLSFPLPIFNMNGAGRSAAMAGVKSAETNKSLAALEQDKLRDEIANVYRQSVLVLSSTLSHNEIEKKHNEIERLFYKGVVSSALVIEAHRTFVELEKSRNERELKALDAFMTVNTLDGKTVENIE